MLRSARRDTYQSKNYEQIPNCSIPNCMRSSDQFKIQHSCFGKRHSRLQNSTFKTHKSLSNKYPHTRLPQNIRKLVSENKRYFQLLRNIFFTRSILTCIFDRFHCQQLSYKACHPTNVCQPFYMFIL